MYKVIILPAAKIDINEAANWYSSKQKGLGKHFIAKVREKVDFIKTQPLAVATRYDEVKTTVLETFPFMIHYTIDENKRLVVDLAVLHTSRHPDMWNVQR